MCGLDKRSRHSIFMVSDSTLDELDGSHRCYDRGGPTYYDSMERRWRLLVDWMEAGTGFGKLVA